MKGELDSGFAAESEPVGVADRTESQSLTEDVAQPSSHAVKGVSDGERFRGNKVNGFIVYTRVKKFLSSCSGELLENNVISKRIKGLQELKMAVDQSNLLVKNVIDESRVVETVIEENFVVKNVIEESQVVDTVDGSEGNCSLDVPICKEEPISEVECQGECFGGTQFAVSESSGGKNGLKKKAKKWLMQSQLKPKVETVEVLVTQSEGFQNETMSLIEVEPIAEGSAFSSPKKNLELKMSKKIVLNKKPMTVTELFETGLLDGVTVVYMGGIKFQASGLRGTIRDGGILCSCSLCNGCRVIPPSKFEIHACKQYRRASQYICFENGKSLLEVLRACRSVPLPMLEATLKSALSSSPEEKSFCCVRCKGTFPITYVGKIGPGPLCNACARSKKTQASVTYVTGRRARSSEPDLVSNPPPSASECITSQNKRQRKKSRKLLEADLCSKSSSKSASMSKLLKKKSPWEITRKLSRPGLDTKSSISASVNASPQNKSHWMIKKKSKKSMLISNPFGSPLVPSSFPDKSQWQMTVKDQRLHKLVFEDSGLPDGTEVGYYARGQKLLGGYKNGSAIICHCCNCEVSPSQFEAHAGWASRKKPYAHIYTSDGVSLHELAISISKGRKFSSKDNDDLCIICADGGNLLLCDGCPRAFHKECASLSSIPQGDWYCNYCQNTFEREKFVSHNVNAVVAGRISLIDPVDQITKRCIRIVKNIEAELSGCVLCRACDFSKSGFGPRTILLCDQCEKEFHVGCLKKHKMADLRELPKGKWFCCMDCSSINSVLQNLLVREAEKLSDSDLNDVKKKYSEKGVQIDSNTDVRWRLLSGKVATPETRFLLSQAVAIFHDCFDPIVDSESGRDLIPSMVYGNMRGQEFGGMYCAVLTVNSSVVSAGILRVFGQEVAELPLVATSKINHGKGFFQLLFTCIEKLLAFLHVKSIVLPAAEEAESIWTRKFGFQYMDPEQLSIYRKSCFQMVSFKGTSMLRKEVSACRIVNSSTEPAECLSGVEVE
ncbi:uncharacterized protein LOC123218096 isoform X2 [Mangifera indica]|uniref:uncharacterized protein LOC123218096 isoform X2 n=1 Tax=Mangifera indica TaxID=29780 RepID=UPI001CF9C220|nr:uncharacterized protein LOC123218096 isoform X2 [Mangifera indica]